MVYLATYITSLLIGTLVWGVRLEGRVNTEKQHVDDIKELIITRFDMHDQYHAQLDARLARIERSLNGNLAKY